MFRNQSATCIRLEGMVPPVVLFSHPLKKSSLVWQGLFEDFGAHDGYSVLAENLIYVAKCGTPAQKVFIECSLARDITFPSRFSQLIYSLFIQLEFVSVLCHLLFISSKGGTSVKPTQQLYSSYEEDSSPKCMCSSNVFH